MPFSMMDDVDDASSTPDTPFSFSSSPEPGAAVASLLSSTLYDLKNLQTTLEHSDMTKEGPSMWKSKS
jgi:hypothetical protein